MITFIVLQLLSAWQVQLSKTAGQQVHCSKSIIFSLFAGSVMWEVVLNHSVVENVISLNHMVG